jgi:hypothetical protein
MPRFLVAARAFPIRVVFLAPHKRGQSLRYSIVSQEKHLFVIKLLCGYILRILITKIFARDISQL